ncbi:MAG: dihydrolipoamide acetyltransferase family protein [Planctomycetota bacterium]
MIQKVTLPALGETVDTSTIERWVKAEGDAVEKGDVLCEITTDKATLEVESYHAGTLLKILAPEGADLPVGALIAVIGDPGEEVPADVLAEAEQAAAPAGAPEPPSAPAGAPEPPSAPAGPSEAEAGAPAAGEKAAPAATPWTEAPAPAAPPSATVGGRVFASPRARRRARQLGVPLESLSGTGPGGRIVEADVVEADERASAVKASPLARKVAASGGVDLAAVQGTGPGGKVMRADVSSAAAPAVRPGEVVPLTAMRRIVAERMTHSKQTIPCYYLTIDVDMTEVACLRAKLNQKANGQPKISFNDFVIKACGRALRQFPRVNSRWVEGGIERRGAAHVGLAVALEEEGLMVPVVRDADAKDLRQVARETADLAQRARTKRLTPDEYRDGCMTVTNLGMFGIRAFIPVVNPGESCILGLGVIQDRVVYRQGGIQVRRLMTMTLSVDHRLVDGAVAAQFLETVRDLLESPTPLAKG